MWILMGQGQGRELCVGDYEVDVIARTLLGECFVILGRFKHMDKEYALYEEVKAAEYEEALMPIRNMIIAGTNIRQSARVSNFSMVLTQGKSIFSLYSVKIYCNSIHKAYSTLVIVNVMPLIATYRQSSV